MSILSTVTTLPTPAGRPRLLITRPLLPAALAHAARLFDLSVWREDLPIGHCLLDQVQGHQALLVMPTERLDAACLQGLPATVRAIATHSVGHDHIDLDAATHLGLPVFHTPDVLTDAVAETAMFLLLAAARQTTHAEQVLRSHGWGPWTPTSFLGRQLTGLRLGIYGMGRIGQALAARARSFGMVIHYHNRSPLAHAQAQGATFHATLNALMAASDAFCVCAPSTPGTRGSVNRERLAGLPPGALFVNVARGDLVDEPALLDAIASGHIGAAGLDVYASEPRIDPRWHTLPRTTLLPHIGSATETARLGMSMLAIDALAAYLLRNERPANCLNPTTMASHG
ncbi:MAG: D-glycerate dehydrogenase [Burkholderiales bacterium]